MKTFAEFLVFEFNRITRRMASRSRYSDSSLPPVSMTLEKDDLFLIVNFIGPQGQQSISIPIPCIDEHNNLIIGNVARRSVGTWYLVDPVQGLGHGREVSYWELMKFILTDRIEQHFAGLPGVSKRSQLERVVVSFQFGSSPLTVRNLQRLIDGVVNTLPMCGTPLQTWAMNHRVVFIDPVFDSLPPKQLLEYQKKKNKLYFPWSSIGLSDSSMPKNYLLKVDLRNYTPFGKYHHNPMRNLYQTLGVRGDELPVIQTKSADVLEQKNCSRTGYNWMTCFLDLPLNFEDQLIINKKHEEKVSTSHRTYLAFGHPVVSVGDSVKKGDILSSEPGDSVIIFDALADSATVVDISDRPVVVAGQKRTATSIVVEMRRCFKDGFKFTNLHGNKGVAVFADTGKVFDPIRGEAVDIDMIVSARTIKNRRNFGQILEALTTLLIGKDKRVVLSDGHKVNINSVKDALVQRGLSEDGTLAVETPWGQFRAVCGWVFWGLTKEPEDALWERREVLRRDQLGLRVSGTKVSHIELRGLITNFGPQSSVVSEILSHQQGSDIVVEHLRIVQSMKGIDTAGVPTINWSSLRPIDQAKTFLQEKQSFQGTIADTAALPENGFMLSLPVRYTSMMKPNGQIEEGLNLTGGQEDKIFETNKIYIPISELVAPWQHQSGLWGISDLCGLINNILVSCKMFVDHPEDRNTLIGLSRVLRKYFHFAAKKLSTKRGLLATHSMAVRYPKSTKATAVVSDSLPENTIEIHQDMADSLGVKHGDFVLVERFPCMGFMSVRAQRVFVSSDPRGRCVIRVSGSSLASQNLDFDGDVLFIIAFDSEAAKAELEFNFRFPNPLAHTFIEQASNKKRPGIFEATLDDFISFSLRNGQSSMTFADLTPKVSSEIAGALIGIKCGTGTSIALGYNLARLMEFSVPGHDTETNAGIEIILDKLGNSVFGSKHAVVKLLERFNKEKLGASA